MQIVIVDCHYDNFQSSLFISFVVREMSFYRSDDMEYYRMIMPRDSAWQTMNILGKYDLVHVVQNKAPHLIKPFMAEVKRCQQSLQKIKNIQKIVEQKKVGHKREFISEEQFQDLNKMWEVHEKTGGNQKSRLGAIQQQVNNIWNYQQQLTKRKNQIKQKLLLYRQNIAIIKAGQKQYGDSFFQIKSSFYQNPQHASIFGLNELQMKAFIAQGKGVLSAKRTINRITRGNSFINQVSFKDVFQSIYPGEENKSVIFALYPAKKNSNIDKKVVKVIENYCSQWQKYTLPQTHSDFNEKMIKLQQNYAQAQRMFELTQDEDRKFLNAIMGKVQGKNINQIEYYKFYLTKEKQIYQQLNQMNTRSNFIDGQVYIQKENSEQVMQLLHKVGTQSQMPIAKLSRDQNSKLPTHFHINDYKMPAQQITNTYGVPQYKQANPSFFTQITFPFLFGVMFGDIAHGLIAFAFGIVLMFQSANSTNTVFRLLFPYRYLITMMGFFAAYCGFIYNDFLSISLNLFGTCFDIKSAEPDKPFHKTSSQCVYPFGLDPAWSMASNNLNYVNSLKMKISVIIAVIHMTLGVFVKASNAIYFRRKLDFIFEFVPQLIFMIALFGYMDFLIVYKWLKPWKLYDANAPSIITTMINMPLKMGKTDHCCGGQPMWGTPGNTSQDGIQSILLVLAVIAIPVMLLPKPIIQICKLKKNKSHHHNQAPQNVQFHNQNQIMKQQNQMQHQMINNNSIPINSAINQHPNINIESSKQIPHDNKLNSGSNVNKLQHRQEGHEDASQIFVHQMIETIEYVLGCISNTASYLRLWALSLAHSQLSQVFFQKTIQGGLAKGHTGIPMLILAFPILAGATFGVLLCMDSMECFLHTLRLHWVQFQSKFYKGNGFIFNPLSFKSKIRQLVAKSA